jgi:hypothetical protein
MDPKDEFQCRWNDDIHTKDAKGVYSFQSREGF